MKHIRIRQGDITTFEVDAIVNAAHEALLGGGGVDGAIHRAAGEQLLQECRDIPDDNGVRCRTGEAYITRGWNLPAKHVIHTVAPKFAGGLIRRMVDGKPKAFFSSETQEEDNRKMMLCYQNCIQVADNHRLKSIAFPSLGTGNHAYPIETACPIAIKTINTMLPKMKHIGEVIFVCFSDDDFNFYTEKAKEILGSK